MNNEIQRLSVCDGECASANGCETFGFDCRECGRIVCKHELTDAGLCETCNCESGDVEK